MSLSTLPVELVHRVFDYCDIQTTLLSVRYVCKSLNEIVNLYNRLFLIFNSEYFYSIKAISHVLQPENVISLILKDDIGIRNSIKFFISLFPINRFTRLRSLTLYLVNYDDLKYILEHLNMDCIVSLSIRSYETEHKNLWSVVSSVLDRCNLQQLSIDNINYQMEHITWPNQYKLSYLAIQDCTLNGYLAILHQLPKLRTFVMRHCSFNFFNNTLISSSTSLSHTSLTSLTITDYSISQENFAYLVASIPLLQHLKLISNRNTFDYVFNDSFWQEFILSKLSKLERFEFFFSYTYSPTQNFVSLESIIVPFRTAFYLKDKHWFVTCAYVPRLRAIWLYTTPICSSDYASPLRCEVSWTDNICRLAQPSITETSDTTVKETSLSIVDLGGNAIGDQGARHLADVLRYNMTITLLDLHDNSVQDQGVRYLAAALQHNKTLKQLNLLRNHIGDQGARYLADILRHNKTLTSLNLLRNQISHQGAQYLALALRYNKTLTTLHLWNNEIGDRGAEYLSVALEHNTTLIILDLGANKIQDTGTRHLADALQYNKTLKQLWLWNNNISSNLTQQLPEEDNRIYC